MIFKGVATALITPFRFGKVDKKALERIIIRQLDGGVNALVVLGTTGEPHALTNNEKRTVLDVTFSVARGVVPIIVGVGSNDTETAVKNLKLAEEYYASGCLAVTPYYNKCTQKGLFNHYKRIAEHTDLPIICYNVPSRTGVNMLPETYSALAKIKNIAGVKEASGNMPQVMEYLRLINGKSPLYSGEDALTAPIMSLGGAGVISVASNVCPKTMRELCDAALNKDFDKASKLQLGLLPLINALFSEVNPIPVKHAMCKLGLCSGDLRLPLNPISAANAKKLDRVLSSLNELN